MADPRVSLSVIFQKGAIMVKSENSKIRVLIYNSSYSAINSYSSIPMQFSVVSDYAIFPILPVVLRLYLFFRFSDYNDYLHDSPIFSIIRFFDPITTTIYTILRFFRLYDSY